MKHDPILWQILREFIAAHTRPQTFAKPSTPEVAIERVKYLEEQFQVADGYTHRN